MGIIKRTSFKLLLRQGTTKIHGWTSITADSLKDKEIYGGNNWKKNSCLDMLFVKRDIFVDWISFKILNHADSCSYKLERWR